MTGDPPEPAFEWDWVTVVVLIVAAVLLALVTFELWIPHDLLPD